jgi:hypothetical protein
MVTGYKTCYWCCQDQDRKQKACPSDRKGAKSRDTLGMRRYNCKSCLNISCRDTDGKGTRTITIWLKHGEPHTPYYDVAVPPEASAMIRQDLEWSTPNSIMKKVQSMFPNVTATQVHTAWTTMSEILWKRDQLQLPSATILLKENSKDVDMFDIIVPEDIQQLAWGMRKIASRLRGKVVEVGIDATCELHVSDTRCYPIMT